MTLNNIVNSRVKEENISNFDQFSPFDRLFEKNNIKKPLRTL